MSGLPNVSQDASAIIAPSPNVSATHNGGATVVDAKDNVQTTSNASGNGADHGEATSKDKRSRLKPATRALIDDGSYGTPGVKMAFNDVASRAAREAVLLPSEIVNRGILEIYLNEQATAVEAVMLNAEALAKFHRASDRAAAEPAQKVRQVRSKKLASLANDNYRMVRLLPACPYKAGTVEAYNWTFCYEDGIGLIHYLDKMDYPRDLIAKALAPNAKPKYFNGPDASYITDDLASGYLGFYDCTKPQDAPDFWIRHPQHASSPAAE